MKCKNCGTDNGEVKRYCEKCGKILEGYTVNNVTGECGYRNADGSFTPDRPQYPGECRHFDGLNFRFSDYCNNAKRKRKNDGICDWGTCQHLCPDYEPKKNKDNGEKRCVLGNIHDNPELLKGK